MSKNKVVMMLETRIATVVVNIPCFFMSCPTRRRYERLYLIIDRLKVINNELVHDSCRRHNNWEKLHIAKRILTQLFLSVDTVRARKMTNNSICREISMIYATNCMTLHDRTQRAQL